VTALAFFSGRYWAAWIYPDHIHTILYDGSETRGYPPDTEAFRQSARDLGYGEDTYWHMVEHDLLHSWLAEQCDIAPSAALWNQAHDLDAWRKTMPACVERDELRVGALQAAMNGLEWGKDRLLEAGLTASSPIIATALFRHPSMTKAWAEEGRPFPRPLPVGWEQ
jgi:hypothetical protein